MVCASNPGRGLRRYDAAAVKADELARQFRGLDDGVTKGKLLAALKGAAPSLGVPPAIVQLVDALFAFTRDVDWRPGHEPVVWPSNDDLAERLGKSVRQVQHYLRTAQALGLITHRDSPNGHRGGARRADESLIWAYGIVLSPIAVRYDELRGSAAAAVAAKRAIKTLRARLAAARRKICALAQTAIDNALAELRVNEEVALARMATAQMRNERDPERLRGCVEQMEGRQRALEDGVATRLRVSADHRDEHYISCSGEADRTHSTTTTHLKSANADYRSGFAEEGRNQAQPSPTEHRTQVEADLEEHGVGPEFIGAVADDLCSELAFSRPSWGPMIAFAERLAGQNSIHRSAWQEACRIMGERGAAASVIATVQKYRTGEVHRPGAYLRGMSGKALRGELRLGKTFHGLKDAGRSAAMRSMADCDTSSAIGHLARRAVGNLAFGA